MISVFNELYSICHIIEFPLAIYKCKEQKMSCNTHKRRSCLVYFSLWNSTGPLKLPASQIDEDLPPPKPGPKSTLIYDYRGTVYVAEQNAREMISVGWS